MSKMSSADQLHADVSHVTHEFIYRAIDSLESAFPVATWRYRDIAIWPLLRGMIRPRLFSVYAPAMPMQRPVAPTNSRRPSLMTRAMSVAQFVLSRLAEPLHCRYVTRGDAK